MEGTAANIVGKYFTEAMVKKIAVSSNGYRSERKKTYPDLKIWSKKNRKVARPITSSCVYHFIALLYYFGMVRLPSKRDYWNHSSRYMPTHSICSELGMTRDRFMFLWRHIHVGEINAEDIDSDEEKEEKEDDADDLMEQNMERVQQDQEEDGSETVDGETVKDKVEEKN